MLRHQQNAQKVNGNNESSIKFDLPYERRIIEFPVLVKYLI